MMGIFSEEGYSNFHGSVGYSHPSCHPVLWEERAPYSTDGVWAISAMERGN